MHADVHIVSSTDDSPDIQDPASYPILISPDSDVVGDENTNLVNISETTLVNSDSDLVPHDDGPQQNPTNMNIVSPSLINCHDSVLIDHANPDNGTPCLVNEVISDSVSRNSQSPLNEFVNALPKPSKILSRPNTCNNPSCSVDGIDVLTCGECGSNVHFECSRLPGYQIHRFLIASRYRKFCLREMLPNCSFQIQRC